MSLQRIRELLGAQTCRITFDVTPDNIVASVGPHTVCAAVEELAYVMLELSITSPPVPMDLAALRSRYEQALGLTHDSADTSVSAAGESYSLQIGSHRTVGASLEEAQERFETLVTLLEGLNDEG